MRNLLLAALISCAAPLNAEEAPKPENWSTLKTEASAIMGELKYQHGDFAGADGTFKDSLNSSRQLMAPQSPLVALDLYRTAELAARRGDYESARQRLDILISRYPETDYAEKGQRLRDLLPKQNDSEDESATVTAVVTADAPEFLLGRIQAATRARRDEEALDLCRDFLRRAPTRPESQEIRLLGAALYLRIGDEKSAERTLRFLVERASDAEVRAKALHLLAVVELSQGRNEDVLRLVPDLDSRRAFSPWVSRAQVWRAGAEAKLGRFELAASRNRGFAEAGISSPARAYALAAIAQDFDRRGQETKTADALGQAAAEAARWNMADLQAAAALSQAHALYKRRRLQAAADAYAAFARDHRDHAQRALSLFQQGLALKRLGQAKRAVAAFARLVDDLPGSVYAADAHMQLGQLYTSLGAADKAVAQYALMGRSGEKRDRHEAQLLMAQVHYNSKSFKRAIPLYWKFLDENPEDSRHAAVEDLLLTSYWLGDRGNPSLLEAVERFPNHPIVSHIRWEMGRQAYKAGDFAKAAEWLARYAAQHPKSARAADGLFYLGEARFALGDAKEAAEAYTALLARFPKSPVASQAKLRLAAAFYQAGDFERSARAYGEAASGAGAAEALLSRALALEKAGRAAEALAANEAWLKKYPKHAKASSVWLAVAQAREKAGRLSDAADAYARVQDDARRPAALFSAGRLREKLKQTAIAARDYAALRACRPANDPSRLRGLLRLGLIHEVGNQPLKAMPLYGEVLRLSSRGSDDFKIAALRLEALSSDKGYTRNK